MCTSLQFLSIALLIIQELRCFCENLLECKCSYQSGLKNNPSFCCDDKEFFFFNIFFLCLSCSFETPLPAKKVYLSPQLAFHSPSMDEEDLKHPTHPNSH